MQAQMQAIGRAAGTPTSRIWAPYCRCTHLCIKGGVGARAVRGLRQVPPEGAAHAAGGGLVQDGGVGLPAGQVGGKNVVDAAVLEHCGALCAVARLHGEGRQASKQAMAGMARRGEGPAICAFEPHGSCQHPLRHPVGQAGRCTLLQMVPVVASQSGRKREMAIVITGQLQGAGPDGQAGSTGNECTDRQRQSPSLLLSSSTLAPPVPSS